MRIHFIAIGGAIMHNLAIALHKKGYEISGSDDVIFNPSRDRLAKYGLLPRQEGWNVANIEDKLDAVILGMHAKPDNPELLKAQEIGLKIYSFPEFVYEQSKNKTRVVIAGSHGKTTTTSMVMHALREAGKDFDYMVGSSVKGFEDSVRLSNAPIIVLEGDEYLTSPIDMRPKFIWYKPQLLMITGIAWDHINVFPTYKGYVKQFRNLVEQQNKGALVYFVDDKELDNIVIDQYKPDIFIKPYTTPQYETEGGNTILNHDGFKAELQIIGAHNLQNLEGARLVCEELGIDSQDFLKSMESFTGAGQRMEKIVDSENYTFYKDFAHAPSKVKASVKAMKEQYGSKEIVALLELHTFSSLNKEFLKEYAGALDAADRAVVFVNPETLRRKGKIVFTQDEMRKAFKNDKLIYLNDPRELKDLVEKIDKKGKAVIAMSSGNWGGVEVISTFNNCGALRLFSDKNGE